jgi:hypothetical protein
MASVEFQPNTTVWGPSCSVAGSNGLIALLYSICSARHGRCLNRPPPDKRLRAAFSTRVTRSNREPCFCEQQQSPLARGMAKGKNHRLTKVSNSRQSACALV